MSVSGRVVDLATGNGRRIEALVLCCDRSMAYLFANPAGAVRTFSATLSDDGSFEFPSIPPGTYSLSAADPKIVYASWALAVGRFAFVDQEFVAGSYASSLLEKLPVDPPIA